MKRNKEINLNQTGAESFDIPSCMVFNHYLDGRLGSRFYVCLILRVLKYYLISQKPMPQANQALMRQLIEHVTCGKSKLYYNLEEFRNIMSIIV